MKYLHKLIETANEWLAERDQGPLTSQEIVYLLNRTSTVLDSAKNLKELHEDTAVSVAKVVCDLRGYKVPPYDEIKSYLDIRKWEEEILNSTPEEIERMEEACRELRELIQSEDEPEDEQTMA